MKEEVYRHLISESRRLSPTTGITLCAETLRMWETLGDLLDGHPWDYPCNCGPHCTPHLVRINDVEGPDAERIRQAAEASKRQRLGGQALDTAWARQEPAAQSPNEAP